MKGQDHVDVRIPDIEIVISAAGDDLAVIAFYFPSNPHGKVEVLASIGEAGAREHMVALLYQGLAALNNEDWYTLAELDTREVSHEGDIPF